MYYAIEALSTGLKSFMLGLGGNLILPVNGSTKAPINKLLLFLEILPKWGVNPIRLAASTISTKS